MMDIILIWFTVFILSTLLFKSAAGSLSLTKPNMISIIYYYSFLVSSYIGSLFIALDEDHFYMLNRLDHEEMRIYGFLIICFIMILFPLTLVVMTKLVGVNTSVLLTNYLEIEPDVKNHPYTSMFLVAFTGLSAIAVLATAYTILYTPVIPVVELIKGNSADLSSQRIEAGRNFSGNVLIRNIFGLMLTPILSLIAFIYFLKRKTMYWGSAFFVLLACSVFLYTYDLAKSPIVFYLLMLVLSAFFANAFKMNVKRILVLGLVSISLLLAMYIAVQGPGAIASFMNYNSGPLGRLLFSQIAPFYLHLDAFTYSLDRLGSSGLPSFIAGLLETEQIRSGRVMMENVFPESIDAGTGGVLNTLYVGEAYAAFGLIGVVVLTIYIAIVVQAVYLLMLKLPKTPVTIAVAVYFTVNFPRTIVGGMADFLFNPIWTIVIAMCSVLLILEYYPHRIKNLLSFLKMKYSKFQIR